MEEIGEMGTFNGILGEKESEMDESSREEHVEGRRRLGS